MLRRNLLRTVTALVADRALLVAAGSAYLAEIAEWRKDYDRDLRSEKGPLFLIGRHPLPEGRTEMGSDASNRIPLPDRAPKRVGVFDRRGRRITFEPSAGIAANLNGKPIQGAVVLEAVIATQRSKLEFGDFVIVVSDLDGKCQVTVSDRQSSYLKMFHGALWYPVDAAYRVEGAYTPYAQPRELNVPDTSGRDRHMKAPGLVTFRLHGEERRLEPVISGQELFFMFKDQTSGRETYGAGRFLESAMPANGKVVLDFNKAYNPYCAFNPFSSCPIPQKQNTLLTRVEAGEKYRRDH